MALYKCFIVISEKRQSSHLIDAIEEEEEDKEVQEKRRRVIWLITYWALFKELLIDSLFVVNSVFFLLEAQQKETKRETETSGN